MYGNTFWEFKDTLNVDPGRMRRIVKYPRSTHYSEVKVSPLWHQWLRHTREQAPSLQEQTRDVVRQERMKVLSAEADARWEAKPRVTDAPGKETGQPKPALNTARTQPNAPEETDVNQERAVRDRAGAQEPDAVARKTKAGQDPWQKARGPSEGWQPEAWTPPAGKKR